MEYILHAWSKCMAQIFEQLYDLMNCAQSQDLLMDMIYIIFDEIRLDWNLTIIKAIYFQPSLTKVNFWSSHPESSFKRLFASKFLIFWTIIIRA